MKDYTVRFYYAVELKVSADTGSEALDIARNFPMSVSADDPSVDVFYCEALDPEVYDAE